MRYRPQLDGLRFCAIAAVVVEHNWDPPAAPWIFGRLDYAEFGVRLFFVLSGFLITTYSFADARWRMRLRAAVAVS